MLQRMILVLDLRATSDIDHNAACQKSLLSAVFDFLKIAHSLDRNGLLQEKCLIETVSVFVLLDGNDENGTAVHHILRQSRPRNVKLSSLTTKIKHLVAKLVSLPLSPSTQATDYAWVHKIVKVTNVASNGSYVICDYLIIFAIQ